MPALQPRDESAIRELIRKLVARELPPADSLPGDGQDLVKTGVIDSMGWVGILSGIEEATAIRNFGASWPEGRPQSIRALASAVHKGLGESKSRSGTVGSRGDASRDIAVSVAGWGYSLGARRLGAAEVEEECGLPAGTILGRAGIQSVSRAAGDETETSLGVRAAELALEKAELGPEDVDVLVATSATSLGFPSLAALLHSRLLVPESCAALDVGGACVGIIHAFAAAQGWLGGSRHRVALIVASEVNSRALARPGVPGEFRGLFGDGASAFVLRQTEDSAPAHFRWGDILSGCAGAHSSALSVIPGATGNLDVIFRGEQLATAAVSSLCQIVERLERLSGKSRTQVDCFALHEPNPRLVEIFAARAGIPMEKIPRIAQTAGNLGSVTCGVNLCAALSRLEEADPQSRERLIFTAAVAPGLLWAGAYLQQINHDKPIS